MSKSIMKEIRRHVRSTDLDNASQMNKVEERIYERNPDTNQIKSRKKGDYGNERIEVDEQVNAYNENNQMEWLDELWGLDKKLVDGKWYISLSDVIKVTLGEYDNE